MPENSAPLRTPFQPPDAPGPLQGLRVLETGDQHLDHCGLLMAAMGADVVKIEPPSGSPSRRIAPFLNDTPDPEHSLFFWAYNRDKRSLVLDLETPAGRQDLLRLLESTDVLLCGRQDELARATGMNLAELGQRFPALITARITPFGDAGPWKDHAGSDLVHLALGGVMMNCGYDPDPSGHYDVPPIAPQAFHASHIAGEQALVGILGALVARHASGQGQDVSCAVHTAVSTSTEMDLMNWVMRGAAQHRQTCRHSAEILNPATPLAQTKDGRWNLGWMVTAGDEANVVRFLQAHGAAHDLTAPDGQRDPKKRDVPGAVPFDEHRAHVFEVVQRFVRGFLYEDLPWQDAQAQGLMWSPLRRPHESLDDPHWQARGSHAWIEHPELGRALPYPRGKWLSTATGWQARRRAPLLGEHTAEVLAERRSAPSVKAVSRPARLSARGKPFALQGVRILDFSWFLASAGGTRMVTALGAECIKVEWKANADARLGANAPEGGREARRTATGPLPGLNLPEMGGHFNHKNAGKRGLSLNIRDPRGLEIARQLVAVSDVVAEGFSPGVMERWGLGYEAMKAIRADIIYVQQSGMGANGLYGRMRTVGPIAAAFTGLSEMSGLPEPAPPAGWGYSYLDWIGAYSFAQAILAGLLHRQRTGEGQWVDASQCESGLMVCGVSALEWAAHRRAFRRNGNRSPWNTCAPHGAYRCLGHDRWIAIACETQAAWEAFVRASGVTALASDARFATLAGRLAHQDELDALVEQWTRTQEPYACMALLQAAGVSAGVCQSAEDRCEHDPQLAQEQWMTEVAAEKIGTWPITEMPFKLSATPSHVGGLPDRGAPLYGEDNEYVLGELLGYSTSTIRDLARDDVI
ncbi:MAG: CaiB/BaiF CoA transferase family protein [Hydrogenophaga sp.]|uniref:CaiB/BaiF CoA transferase family protein n=1 Tax=Hydrogenophaga sp. TaxID=1904254 RepID=UPI003D0D407E